MAGFLLKAQCLSVWDGRQYERLCYNDIQPLYSARGIDQGVFPYVDGDLTENGLVRGAIEYPVLTGLFMWLMGTFVSKNVNGYLVVTAIFLAPFAMYAAYKLMQLVGKRALLWAAAPALVLYAFHNWDLLVVAAVVAGMAFWWRDRPLAAAIAFGIGGALKIFPLLFLLPLALWVWKRKGWRSGFKEGLTIGLAGAATFLLINLPFMLINFDGWWASYEFHQNRVPNYDTIWAIKFPGWPPDQTNLVTFTLTGVTFLGVLAYSIVRSTRDEEDFPFLETSAALLAGFLLWNKVHSPQYTLWILPFFVLLRVHWLWWLAYTAADLMVYVGVFRFFYAALYYEGNGELAQRAMEWGVYGRAVLLLGLVVIFVTARPYDPDASSEEEEVVSHPPPKVAAVGDQAPA